MVTVICDCGMIESPGIELELKELAAGRAFAGT
jgi:hypothetical protein